MLWQSRNNIINDEKDERENQRNRKIPCYIGYRSTLEDIEKKTDKSDRNC